MVTFNQDVTVIGDGSEQSKVISGDKLYEFEKLKEFGVELGKSHLAKNVAETGQELIEKTYGL